MLLFERDDAFAQMRELSSGRRETPRVGLVSGPVGTGKTAMLRVYARSARDDFGCHVLTASCSPDERELPLALIKQLFDHDIVPPESRDSLVYAIEQAAAAGDQAGTGSALVPAVAHLAEESQSVLKALAVSAPVIMCVDDIHHADRSSLQVLLFLLRRLPSGRFVLFAADSPHVEFTLPRFRPELTRRACFYPIAVDVLSAEGVQQALSVHLDDSVAERLEPVFREASGGNPLLLNALLEDTSTDTLEPVGIGNGDAFRNAALSLLLRLGPEVRPAAEAVAVLGSETTPITVAELIEVSVDDVSGPLAALAGCGVLGEAGYCHAALDSAVLADVSAEDRSGLHLRAAQVAHQHGADALVVAEHFVAAGSAPAPWAVRVLLDAAAQAEATRRPRLAAECLDLARAHCSDDTQRARTMMSLARLEWRSEPSTAARHLVDLIEHVHAGRLDSSDAVMIVRWLLWLGRIDEARDLVDTELSDAEEVDDEVRSILSVVHRWYPDSVHGEWARSSAAAGRLEPSASAASSALESVLADGGTDRSAARAEQVLSECELGDATLPALVCALETLVHSDRHESAAGWCDSLLREAATRQAPTWEAALAAVRAEAALHGGDLVPARKWAAFALGRISRRSWGTLVALPMSVLLQALIGLSQHDEAAELARQVVPEQVFDGIYGLRLLRARGEFYLATNRLHAAQDEFERWGAKAEEWDCDLPAREPWRTSLARIHVRFDSYAAARELATAQLARPGGQSPRSRAEALRIIAAASDIRRRPAILREALDLFQTAADRVQQAVVMAELSRAHTGLGEFNRARLLTRRALEVAAECGATQLCRALLAGGTAALAQETAEEEPDTDESLDVLSDAERRVAELAVMGHTNREIGGKLFITVSTVEQHLTRIYRKLGVTRRADLPLRLPTRSRALPAFARVVNA